MFLRAAAVSRKEEGEEKNLLILFAIWSDDVGLEVIHREEVSAGGLRPERVSTTVGGGALEGPWEGGVPTTSSQRGGFIPYLP